MNTNSWTHILAAALSAVLTLSLQADIPPEAQKPASTDEKPGSPTVPGSPTGNGSDAPTAPLHPKTPSDKPVATPPSNPPGTNGSK